MVDFAVLTIRNDKHHSTSHLEVGGLIGTVTSQKDGLASKEYSIFNKGNLRASELRTGFSYSSQDTPDGRNSAIISFAADGGFGASSVWLHQNRITHEKDNIKKY